VGKNMEKSPWILINNYLDVVLVSGVLHYVQLSADEVVLYFADFSMELYESSCPFHFTLKFKVDNRVVLPV
jgi:hypothetical protein